MCFIENENEEIIHDSNAISNGARHFYENLYASRENETVSFEIQSLINDPALSDEESNKLEGLITKQEVLSALKCMKHDKSPGSDGYTAEFFQVLFCGFRWSYAKLWSVLSIMDSTRGNCQ